VQWYFHSTVGSARFSENLSSDKGLPGARFFVNDRAFFPVKRFIREERLRAILQRTGCRQKSHAVAGYGVSGGVVWRRRQILRAGRVRSSEHKRIRENGKHRAHSNRVWIVFHFTQIRNNDIKLINIENRYHNVFSISNFCILLIFNIKLNY